MSGIAEREGWWCVIEPSGKRFWMPEDPHNHLQAAWADATVEGPFVPAGHIEAARVLLWSLIETDDSGRCWLADDPGPTAGRILDYLEGGKP
jgi:hypothetical protein